MTRRLARTSLRVEKPSGRLSRPRVLPFPSASRMASVTGLRRRLLELRQTALDFADPHVTSCGASDLSNRTGATSRRTDKLRSVA